VGVLRRDEIVDAPRAKWRVAVPEMEEIIRKREQTREICTRIFDNGFESLAVKLLFRERMAEDAHELLRRLEDPKNFEQEYAKIIILRKTGDTIRAKHMINSTKEEKTIEEMELLGIELAKIDSIAARRLADVHLEKYPKSMEVWVAAAKILEAVGDPKSEEIKKKIRKKLETSQYPRKVKNRANIILFGEKAQADWILDVAQEDKKEIHRRIAQLPKEEVREICLELEDLLKGHYFEITNPKVALEALETYIKLRERGIQIESKQVATILEILEKRGVAGVALAIGEFEKIDWKFSERRGEIVEKIAKVALEDGGTRLLRSVVAKIAIESREKKLFLEIMEIARKNKDGSSVEEKYDQAIRAKLLSPKDASKEAKKIEETDILLATRIRSHFGEELAEELLDSLIAKAQEMENQTLKDCITKIFEIEEIRKGRSSKKVEQLMRIYEKRRDTRQMN
jgi:hypothetical protein